MHLGGDALARPNFGKHTGVVIPITPYRSLFTPSERTQSILTTFISTHCNTYSPNNVAKQTRKHAVQITLRRTSGLLATNYEKRSNMRNGDT